MAVQKLKMLYLTIIYDNDNVSNNGSIYGRGSMKYKYIYIYSI